jgi:hypothetical protein
MQLGATPRSSDRLSRFPWSSTARGVLVACALGVAPSAWGQKAQPAPAGGTTLRIIRITTPTVVGPDDRTITKNGASVPLSIADLRVIGTTLTISGRHQLGALTLRNGATLTHAAGSIAGYNGVTVEGVQLLVQERVVIDATSAIDVSGKGYAPNGGPGRGYVRSGGGHGGAGGHDRRCAGTCGDDGGVTYGDFVYPATLGSGAADSSNGHGGAGGGAVVLVADAVKVAGSIRADGADGVGGSGGNQAGAGGAGGTIRIEATSLWGSGDLSADGGVGAAFGLVEAAGGGGGRIALHVDTDNHTGAVTAYGGDSQKLSLGNRAVGGAGTVYVSVGGVGTLTLDNNGLVSGLGGLVTGGMTDMLGPVVVDNLVITGSAGMSAPRLTWLDITVWNDATIDVGARIDVSGRGYPPRQGPGAGKTTSNCSIPGAGMASGGAHGADGVSWYQSGSLCIQGSLQYGDPMYPTTFGSGGGANSFGVGGYGGGAVRLVVGGTLTLEGEIHANGSDAVVDTGARLGGGSGGSILVDAGQFVVNGGNFYIEGGDGKASTFNFGDGGTGGRAALLTPNAIQGTGGTVYWGGGQATGGAGQNNSGSYHYGGP